MICYNTSVE